jgi:leucyl/phenylalanyl-tRNA---protein transferase
MAILEFPTVELADSDGFLCVGGDLEVSSLLLAYRSGIFPWPVDKKNLTWFAPPRRALLFLDELHISRSLRREQKRHQFTLSFNRDFAAVIEACAELKNRGSQRSTWIHPGMQQAYLNLHRAGYAHSVEAFLDERLVGGLYGVSIAGLFAGESMFYRQPEASKMALLFLLDHLQEQQVPWIDIQMLTPLLRQMGAREVSRAEYMKLLSSALTRPALSFPRPGQT